MPALNLPKKQMLDYMLGLGTPKLMLLTASHTTNIDTQEFADDISANELSSAGYTAGGVTLANVTSALNTTLDKVVLDADDVALTGLTGTVRYTAVVIDTGTPATSPVLCIEDLGSDQVLTADDFNLTVNANGLYRL